MELEQEELEQLQEELEEDEEQRYRCPHYKRKCQFVTPCCDGLYRCRFCHDEEENHTLRRDDVSLVECSHCGVRQGVRENCQNCHLKFGQYFCFDCKLYDDEDKQQFHCSGCGICRVGGRDNYFHCHRCDMCLPNHLKDNHKCVEKVSRSNCPVCQEDIHTSRIPSQIPPCNHLIHKTCFDEMLTNGHYACPVCGVSMMDMADVWKIYDREISETPMPSEYIGLHAAIQCRDCFKPGHALFHILGMKCEDCGSYNTVREKGPLMRRDPGGGSSFSTSLDPDLAAMDQEDEDVNSNLEEELPELETNSPLLEQLEGSSSAISMSTDSMSLDTPPETPTRMEPPVLGATGSIPTARPEPDSSVSMTPSPSPQREAARRGASSQPSASAIRRLDFGEEGGGGGGGGQK